MPTADSAVDVPLLSPAAVRLHEPIEEPSGLPEPETAPFQIVGVPALLRHWSAAAWASIPEANRPTDVFPGNQGGYFRIEADPEAGPT